MYYRIGYLADGVKATQYLHAPHAARAVSEVAKFCAHNALAFELLSVELQSDARTEAPRFTPGAAVQ